VRALQVKEYKCKDFISFRTVCLTDRAMNVVRLMHCEFCRMFIIPCPVSYRNLMLILKAKSSGMLCFVLTGEQIPALWRGVLRSSSGSSSVLLRGWTLTIGGAHSSETLVTLYQSTRFYIPEGLDLHQHCCGNFKSQMW
jgi:hypothetical protein